MFIKNIFDFLIISLDQNHKKSSAKLNLSKYQVKWINPWLLIIIILLSLIGIIMVYNSSVAIAIRDFSDQYYYVREQLKWIIIGLFAMIFCTFLNYKVWIKFAFPMFIITLCMLLLVFVPVIGVKALGAHRWIKIGPIIIQPAEVAKLTIIVYLSAWLSTKETNRLIPFLLFMGMIVGLVVIEPDLGTSIILVLLSIVIYFCSGAPLKHLFILMPLLVCGIIILAVISPYRFQRIMTFIHPESDPQGASYQIRQALLAIGSGGPFGLGLGKSRQKYEYLPEANTDSIFAVYAEELGFVGATGLILLYIALLWIGFKVARNAPTKESRLMALGITSWMGIQSGLNISAITGLMPLTGIPLPLISSGGSSLIVSLSALGILLNISRLR
jgi:cell division protein FtsW